MNRFNISWTVCVVLSTLTMEGQPTRSEIAAGAGHGILLKSDGSVLTWGGNAFGQLGREDDDSWAPAQVPTLSEVQKIAAGDEFSMALKRDGTVWAWGANQDGQLGNGTKRDSPLPVAVGGLPHIVSIAAAGKHALALDLNGIVWGWGSVPNRTSNPVSEQVPNLSNVVAIAAGDNHSIALDRSGHVWVWGDHGAGALSDNCFVSYYPQLLPGLSDITAIAGGYQLTVALRKDGTVWSIGYGEAGQHGDGATGTSTKPIMAKGIVGVKAIAARYMNVVALKDDGTVWGWGSNHYGQLGNPAVSAEDSTRPVRVDKLVGIMAIAAGGNHTVAVDHAGAIWTWGVNDGGGLGADSDSLHESRAPMHPGQFIPPPCLALFSCLTASGRAIQICGEQDPADTDRFININYRFGPTSGPPDLMFPSEPQPDRSPLVYYETPQREGIRFSNGRYTYRVYIGTERGGGVEVTDAKGKRLSNIGCAERPQVYREDLRNSFSKPVR